MARKPISKKLRFEVFKRDSFKCQYCGAEAPKAILQVDHINPVAKGGKNDLLNLITSCFDCNSGKSDRTLSDDSAVNKQRQQLEELNARREQLEMMLQWRDGLAALKVDEVKAVQQHFNKAIPGWFVTSESAVKGIKSMLRKHALITILDAIDLAAERYVEHDAEGKPTSVSVEAAWRKVGGILAVGAMDPEEKRLHYIKGIVRNRMYMPHYFMTDLKHAAKVGVDVCQIEHEAKTARNWTQFNQWLQAAIDEAESK